MRTTREYTRNSGVEVNSAKKNHTYIDHIASRTDLTGDKSSDTTMVSSV